MDNPFELLGQPQLDNPEGEEVTGAFTCQDCFSVVTEARYLDEIAVLTWICPNEHINKIKEFHLD